MSINFYSFRTGFSNLPIFSISTTTVSPCFIQTGGLRAKPTPWGVPVRITLPGRRVMVLLRDSIRVGTSKIMSAVVWSCMIWPLRMVLMRRVLGLGISSLVTMCGAERAEGVEALAAGELAAAEGLVALPVAAGDVVGAGVAEDVVEGLLARHVLGGLADDDGELALVVDLAASAWG